MSLLDLLTQHPADPSDTLVSTLDAAFTKVEILAQVDALAADIEAHLTPGDSVAVVGDGLTALIGMFATWRASGVFVPINPRQPDIAIDAVVARSEARVVVRHGAAEPRETRDATRVGDAAMVLWTSGTTGEPKPILHTHGAYCELIDRVLGPLRGGATRATPSANLIPVSMSLNAGIYNALFGLRAGAPLVLMDRFTPDEFATLVTRHQIRSTVLPPAAIAMLNDEPGPLDLTPLRYVRSITAPLSPFQAKRFTARFGAFVLNGYGQAEIGEVIGWTAADAKAHPDKIGAIGRAHPGVEIAIDGADSANDGVGELLVRPPNHAVDLPPERLTDEGFIRTGDLARVDDDGFVWLEGRQSDVINRGGNKVFPDEVEEVLASVAGVREVTIVARTDDRLGQVPVAVVVGDVADEDLEAAARAHLVAYKVPVAYVRRDSLPRSEVGKVLRRQLAEELA